jgi:transposase
VIAAVIKDLGLIDMINARLMPDAQAVMTPGEAIAGMILNGLGFANRAMSLTPPFFAHKPLDLLCREGIRADMFNRLKLGRTLDDTYADGCDLLFQELALAVCAHEGVDLRFNHLDTTSFALSGEYLPERDEQAMRITHGDSKDHRPDLKQAVLELMVSPDGGVPFVSKSWDGKTSDTRLFAERAQTLMTAFKTSPRPRYLMADAKLYTENNAANLRGLGFITRMANTISVVSHVIEQALTWDTWHAFDETTRYQGVELCH